MKSLTNNFCKSKIDWIKIIKGTDKIISMQLKVKKCLIVESHMLYLLKKKFKNSIILKLWKISLKKNRNFLKITKTSKKMYNRNVNS